MKNCETKIPLNKALGWILISVLLILGSTTLGVLYFQFIKESHGSDDAYRIVAIVQTTPDQVSLKNAYLAELLDLSVDQSTNLYRFNSSEARRKLLSSPLIKEANVKRIKPGTVYVDYILRKPVAFLADFSNTAVDIEGAPFPFYPFFTPKRLPEIYLGSSLPENISLESCWRKPLQTKEMALALEVLSYIAKNKGAEMAHVRRIDVSRAYASSCGQRQIVLNLEEQVEIENKGRTALFAFPYILRLNCDNYQQSLANFHVIHDHLMQQELKWPADDIKGLVKQPTRIIDLRLPHLAYMATSES